MYLSLPNIPDHRRNPRRSLAPSESFGSRTFSSHFGLPSVRAERTKTFVLTSKNLFTTTLKEETEEIVENSYDHTPLCKETIQMRMPKTITDLRSNFKKKSELVEENKLRRARIYEYFDEFRRLTSNHESHLDINGQFRDRKSNSDLRDKMIRLGENLLSLYNIQFNVVDIAKQDSIMKIERVADKFVLAKVLHVVIGEMAKFPYSFFKKIGLTAFTFCQSIQFYKELGNPIVTKKLLSSGMIILDELPTPEDVIDEFYKIVFSHLKNQVQDLDAHWSKVYIRKSKTIIHTSMNAVIKQSTKPKKSYFEEQCKMFKELVMNPNNTLKNESNVTRIKAFKLKDCMDSVDSDGITEEWWQRRGLTLVIGSLDHF